MANFDQRGQKVVNQINAESVDVVNFGAVQNKIELVTELRKLLSELNKTTEIKHDVLVNVETHINNAIVEAEKPEPKKKSILGHIEGAKSLLEGITSATGLITALIQAAKIAGSLFL